MIHRERMEYPDYVYPSDPWKFIEKRFYPRYLGQIESIFSLGNGYLGMRGNCEEGTPAYQRGTFVNGFYESWPIIYGEEAFGFAQTGQTMVNLPDSFIIKLYVDDEPLFLPTADLVRFERTLDMQAGLLERLVLWETPSSKRVLVKSRRLVSFVHRHVAAIDYEVTVLNAVAPVIISSQIDAYKIADSEEEDNDPRRSRGFKDNVLVQKHRSAEENRLVMGYSTRESGMTLACGFDHRVETECGYTACSDWVDDSCKTVFAINAKPGLPFRLSKFIAYHTSRSRPPRELCERTERTLERASLCGFDRLLEEQRTFMDAFWERSDIEVEGNDQVQQTIRFNLFHLLQALGRAEGAGLPAKGLTGEGYEGHYFWDGEIYVLPFFVYTTPNIARTLLRFRYSMLTQARERARQINQKGALFPWRTISGEEASAYYAAGTAQYHINADIIYALRKYVQATGDRPFLYKEGAEMLVETARLWCDLGFFSKKQGGKFCIHGVTGPDEYNTVVNNNTYTNLMARENLRYAVETVEHLVKEKTRGLERLIDRTGFEPSELEDWKKAADQMYIPYDEELGFHPQDDNFLDKEKWDLEHTPKEKFPLLLHYHPLVIYRHQVIKQADVVLANFLLGNEFTDQEKKRNFDYYDTLTTGDSSLSASIQSIVAYELGYLDKGREYGMYALLMDLADIGGNVNDGLHMASMGGTWMAIVHGIAGMRDYGGRLSFQPKSLAKLQRIRFPLTVQGQVMEVDIHADSITYSLRSGDGLTIHHTDEEIELVVGKSITRPIKQKKA